MVFSIETVGNFSLNSIPAKIKAFSVSNTAACVGDTNFLISIFVDWSPISIRVEGEVSSREIVREEFKVWALATTSDANFFSIFLGVSDISTKGILKLWGTNSKIQARDWFLLRDKFTDDAVGFRWINVNFPKECKGVIMQDFLGLSVATRRRRAVWKLADEGMEIMLSPGVYANSSSNSSKISSLSWFSGSSSSSMISFGEII